MAEVFFTIVGVLFGFVIAQWFPAKKNDRYLLNLIIQKLNTMSQAGDEIKQALADANAKLDKIQADEAKLLQQIADLSLSPTAAEVQEIKDAAAALNARLQATDDAVPE